MLSLDGSGRFALSDALLLYSQKEPGTKVGPDQLEPPVRVGSTRINSDQLGSNKKNKNKIKLDSNQLGS